MPIQTICDYCNKVYFLKPSRLKRKHQNLFCSYKCKSDFQKGVQPVGFKLNKIIKGKEHFNYGRKHTEETKRKISKKCMGNPAWNKGLNWSEEIKKKMSITRKGNPSNRKGAKHTDKTKQILRTYRLKQIIPNKDTSIEIKLQDFLKRLNINFETHKPFLDKYQCDIFIPSSNLIIEADGDYWHNFPEGLEKDRKRDIELLNKGFKILRLWEHQINKLTIDNFNLVLESYKL